VGIPVRGAAAVVGGLVLALATAFGWAGDGGWTPAGERDGIVVEQRAVTESPIRAVRGRGRSPLPPPAILETIWNQREYPQFVPYLKRLDVLAEGPDELLVYEQVAMPLVATDRDYTIRLRRMTYPDTGRIEVAFASADAEGPPENDAHVRVRTISGSWVIEPDPAGGSRATYTVQSDPGGAIPAWLVNRLQATVVARFVSAVLARAAARHGGR
jgi:ribosome-associated toxin RatA of RatAB toxin-antitoxin module